MKPDGGVMEGAMDETELDVGEFFHQLGMLVIESRVPAMSVKGRQDGPHCPHAVSDWPAHVCDPVQPLCIRASQIHKQIHALWRNHVPVCIEVLLFPVCQHGRQKCLITDVPPPVSSCDESYVLLEQWTVQCLTKKSTDICVSTKALIQAMRSYLHFSQLSAWLNLTHGTEPQCIGYRISPPAEFCTTAFTQAPEIHTFPFAHGNKSSNIRVSLAHMPRLNDIPQPVCHERQCTRSSPPNSSSPIPQDSTNSNRRNLPEADTAKSGAITSSSNVMGNTSPRLDKPNVLHAFSTSHGYMTMSRTGRCQCEECCGRDVMSSCAGEPSDDIRQRRPSLEHPTVALLKRQTSSSPTSNMTSSQTAGRCQSDTKSAASDGEKSSGAIPKRLSLVMPAECDLQWVDDGVFSPSEEETAEVTSCSARSKQCHKMSASPMDILSDKAKCPTSSCTRGGNKSTTAWQKDNTDSDGSLPDFDLFLSKTLVGRHDPLSPEEMESYLRSLCPLSSKATKWNEASPNGTPKHHQSVQCYRLLGDGIVGAKQQPRCPDLVQNDKSLNSFVEAKSFNETSVVSKVVKRPEQSCDRAKGIRDCMGDVKQRSKSYEFDTSIDNENGCVEMSDSVVDCCARSTSQTSSFPNSSSFSNGSSYSNGSSFSNGSEIRPVFTVGESLTVNDKISSNSQVRTDVESHQPVIHKNVVNGCVSEQTAPRLYVKKEIASTPLSTRTIHKSVSCPNKQELKSSSCNTANSLLRTVMKKELLQQQQQQQLGAGDVIKSNGHSVPTEIEKSMFRRSVQRSSNMVFHASTGLPLQSSPVPAKKMPSGSFDYDVTLNNNIRAIKNSLSCINLDKQNSDGGSFDSSREGRTYSTSAPASTNCLLGNFEESLINGRIEPSGVVEGFTVDIGASGSFCPRHVTLPVTSFFFSLSDDNAPSPYLGHINLESYSKRGYHVPTQGTIQVTLFNPSKTVVKMFVVTYDMTDMPVNSQTFLRQRTLYMPVRGSVSDVPGATIYLRYLIHLRFASSKSNKIYLHTDIRVIFARDKFELDSRVANYELRSFTEGPVNPKYSPKK